MGAASGPSCTPTAPLSPTRVPLPGSCSTRLESKTAPRVATSWRRRPSFSGCTRREGTRRSRAVARQATWVIRRSSLTPPITSSTRRNKSDADQAAPARALGPRFAMSSSTVAVGLPQPDLVAAIPRLRRYARVLTRNRTRADDLVQDTLLRAWDKRRLWQVGTDLRAWLFTIMHNVHQNQRELARREAANISLDAEGDRGPVWQTA